MQVTVDETLTAIHQCQLLTFQKDDTVSGDIAAYLLRTGAAVSPADDDAQRLADGVLAEEETLEAAEQSGDSTREVTELDISGTIDQVLAWVGGNPDRALAAHAAEEARGDKARSSLLAKLTDIGVGS